ncbi:DUF92 domain-containing protein [Paenibacillus aquistagni]|uniref:DUF92 domain-containing protein n=1 Tax=Paenibacillus aquistagni TaxID=1852522 RepID=UPI000B50C086|nr:DUF92 domain-containing protein [Paenibacillus aquistagni]
MDLFIGFAGSLLVAGAAFSKKSLTLSGAIAAVLMGTIYYGLGSLIWFGLLLTFFVTSTFWTKWKKRAKRQFDHVYEKSGARDAYQVFANGGIGMLLCIIHYFYPHEGWLFVFAGVMATVNADTWATEIGGLSRRSPHSLLTGKEVPAGTSGAISLLGTQAAIAGAMTIGLAAMLFLYISLDPAFAFPYTWLLLCAVGVGASIGGVAGCFTDSFLGATVQSSYQCTSCGALTEKQLHCDRKTLLKRGFRWMNNDIVNLLSSIVGGLVAWGAGALLLQLS